MEGPSAWHYWWRRRGSNPRPPHCERGALPAELRPHRAKIIVDPQLGRKLSAEATKPESAAAVVMRPRHQTTSLLRQSRFEHEPSDQLAPGVRPGSGFRQ